LAEDAALETARAVIVSASAAIASANPTFKVFLNFFTSYQLLGHEKLVAIFRCKKGRVRLQQP
jgi:hypothetical protein